jgi:hypothetical protein
MMDADIASWDAKRFYDSVRPATAIPLRYRGKPRRSIEAAFLAIGHFRPC